MTENDALGFISMPADKMFDHNDLAGIKSVVSFRDESRTKNVTEKSYGRSGKLGAGYINAAPRSMFIEESQQKKEAEQLVVANVDEFAICLVSMFPDFSHAWQHFDANNSGSCSVTEFVAAMKTLGFTAKDGKKIFREMDSSGEASKDQALNRRELAVVWQMGGGSLDASSLTRARSLSPCTATTKLLAAAAGPPIVHSFGPFLECATRTTELLNAHDHEDPIAVFARWAGAGGKWHILHSLFPHQDKMGMSAERGKLRANDFVNFLRTQGYDGNAVRIFAEIQREGPHHQRSRAGRLAAGLDAEDDVELEEDQISIAQLIHFQKRAMAMVSDSTGLEEGPHARRLINLLMKKRGSMLRAFRLDLDVRRGGRVASGDFAIACKNLGIASEARTLWNAFRPKGNCAPLELADLDSEEAANVDRFAECLWSNFGFDLERAWSVIDVNRRKIVTLEDWLQGMKCLGFEGNAKLLFWGLDDSGVGRIRRHEFEYMNVLCATGMRCLHSAPAIRALCSWVQGQFGGAEVFLTKVGFDSAPKAKTRDRGRFNQEDWRQEEDTKLGVSDLAARLTALGYPGDALQAAMIAARTGGDCHIERDKLLALLRGKRDGAPPMQTPYRSASARSLNATNTTLSTTADSSKTPRSTWRPKKVWKDSVDNISICNDKKPACVRNYFGVHEGMSGFGIAADSEDLPAPRSAKDRKAPSRSVSPKVTNRDISPRVDANRDVSPKVDTNRAEASARAASASPRRRLDFEKAPNRPGWHNELNNSSAINAKRSAYARKYFSSFNRNPVKQELAQRRSVYGSLRRSKSASLWQPGGNTPRQVLVKMGPRGV